MNARRANAMMLSLAITAIIAISAALALGVVAAPSNFRDRLPKADAQRASAMEVGQRGNAVPGPTVACTSGAGGSGASLSERLGSLLIQRGLTVARFEAISADEVESGAFTAVEVWFEAFGPYARTVEALEYLASSASMVSVERIDLMTEGAKVKLVYSGRLYCVS